MEENILTKKIQRQGQYIKDQVNRYRKSFQSKIIQVKNFAPYLSVTQNAFNLNINYLQDYLQYIPKKNMKIFINNQKVIFNDIHKKLKSLQLYIIQASKQTKSDSSGICKICTMQIQQRNIYDAKNKIQNDDMNVLKKMFKKIQQQNAMPLFSPDQDKQFFRKLHRALGKKQQILMVTDNHLQIYLQSLMKNLRDLKFVENQLKQTFVDSIPQNINWTSKLKSQLNEALLKEFQGRIPPWVQKSFDYLSKLYQKLNKKSVRINHCQTDQFDPNQMNVLNKRIQQYRQQQRINRKLNLQNQNQLKQLKQELRKLTMENQYYKKALQEKQILQANMNIMNKTGSTDKKQKSTNSKLKKTSKLKFVNTKKDNCNSDQNQLQQNYQQRQNFQQRTKSSVTEHYQQNDKNINVSNGLQRNSSNLQKLRSLRKSNILPSIKSRASQFGFNKDMKKKTMLLNTSLRYGQNGQIIESDKQNNDQKQSQYSSIIEQYKKTISQVNNTMQKNLLGLNQIKKISKIKNQSFLTGVNNITSNNQQTQIKSQRDQQSIAQNQNSIIHSQTIQQNKQNLNHKKIQRTMKKKQGDNQYLRKDSEGSSHSKIKQMNQLLNQLKVDKLKRMKKSYQKVQTKQISIQTEIIDNRLFTIMQDYIQNIDQMTNKLIYKMIQTVFSKKKQNRNKSKQLTNNSSLSKIELQNYNKKFKTQSNKTCKILSNTDTKDNIEQDKQGIINKLNNQVHQDCIQVLSPRKTFIFTKDDFSLYLGEQNCYKFEINLKKKYHKIPFEQLTNLQNQYFTSVYKFLQTVKTHAPDLYSQTISFIKYPYQSVINDFSMVAMTKQMSLPSFLSYISRIKYFHTKCHHNKKQQNKSICIHFDKFIQKIQDIFAEKIYHSENVEGWEYIQSQRYENSESNRLR